MTFCLLSLKLRVALRSLALVLGLTSSVMAAEPAAGMGTVLFRNICAQCHGQKGEGNEQLKAPSIAGLPGWYVLGQLRNFREGRRGTDAQQPHALLMAATAKALAAEHLQAVADAVAALEMVRPARPAKEPAEAVLAEGRLLFEERCMECHRYNGTGEIVFGSAQLIGLQEWYLEAQLHNFKTAKRGTVPGDANGSKMVTASQHIENEAALKAVVAYIMTLNYRDDPFR